MSQPDKGGQEHLVPSRTRSFILSAVFGAAVRNSMLASGINRTLVDMPAWQHVGAPARAAFSRWADLGRGKILYPLEGIGGAVLSLVAAIIFHLWSTVRKSRGRFMKALSPLVLLVSSTTCVPTTCCKQGVDE